MVPESWIWEKSLLKAPKCQFNPDGAPWHQSCQHHQEQRHLQPVPAVAVAAPDAPGKGGEAGRGWRPRRVLGRDLFLLLRLACGSP